MLMMSGGGVRKKKKNKKFQGIIKIKKEPLTMELIHVIVANVIGCSHGRSGRSGRGARDLPMCSLNQLISK